MGQYVVTAPCAYLVDGKAIVHRRTGLIVEVADETAAGLPGVLVPVDRPVADTAPESTVVVDVPPTGPAMPFIPAAATADQPDTEPEATGDEAKSDTAPRRRGKSEAKADGEARQD